MTDTRSITLPCISLWQPYASLLFVQGPLRKLHETRPYRVPQKHLGAPIAIHATKHLHVTDELDALAVAAFGSDYREQLPRGAVLGSVRFGQWIATDFALPGSEADRIAGDWSPGRFAWLVSSTRKLDVPFLIRGKQGWFSAPMPFEHGDCR